MINNLLCGTMMAMAAVLINACGAVEDDAGLDADSEINLTVNPRPSSDRTIWVTVSGESLAYSWNTEPGQISTELTQTTIDGFLQKFADNDVDCDIDRLFILQGTQDDNGRTRFTSRLTALGCSGYILVTGASENQE